MNFQEYVENFSELTDAAKISKFNRVRSYLIKFLNEINDADGVSYFLDDFGTALSELESDDAFGTEGMKL